MGHLGIKNLGCICYMIALLQQFFNIERLRYGVLKADAEGVLRARLLKFREKVTGLKARQAWINERKGAGLPVPEGDDEEPAELVEAMEAAKAAAAADGVSDKSMQVG